MLILRPFTALFSCVLLQMMGLGLLSTFLSLRLSVEGFSHQTTGWVLTLYYAGLVIGASIDLKLIRRVGHIRAYAAFAALTIAAIMLHGIHISPVFWAGLRFISGISNMGMYMVIESWFNGCTASHHRGRIFSIYMVVNYLGTSLGQNLLNIGDIRDGSLFLVVGFFLVSSIIPIALTRTITPDMPETTPLKTSEIIRTAPIGVLGCLVSGILGSAYFTMSPVFAHAIGMDTRMVSQFMAMTILGGLLFQWPIGFLSDRVDRSIVLPVLAAALSAASAAVFMSDGRPFSTLVATSMVFGGILFTLYPVSVARAHDRFDASEVVNVSAALLLAYGIGSIIGPPAAGAVMTRMGTPYGFYGFCLAVGLLFAAGVLILRRTELVEIIPPEQQEDFIIMDRTSPVAFHMDPRSDSPDAAVENGA